tara:strand:+ start:186 stop:365 length:180 start_codon:yes stop_codon:yes gene_type:complete
MIQVGELVRIKEGVYVGKLALVLFKPFDNVARVKILDPIATEYQTKGYTAYNTASLEKL